MKKGIVALFLLSLLFTGSASAMDHSDHHHSDHGQETETAEKDHEKAVDAGNKICPVMDSKIEQKAKVTYEYQGVIYNFCCPYCISAFKKNPGKYLAKVEKELEEE